MKYNELLRCVSDESVNVTGFGAREGGLLTLLSPTRLVLSSSLSMLCNIATTIITFICNNVKSVSKHVKTHYVDNQYSRENEWNAGEQTARRKVLKVAKVDEG